MSVVMRLLMNENQESQVHVTGEPSPCDSVTVSDLKARKVRVK
jgi:hypothetical protein